MEALNSGLRSAAVPLPNLSASHRLVLAEKRRQDLRRKQSAAATRFGHHERLADLLAALAKLQELSFRVLVLFLIA